MGNARLRQRMRNLRAHPANDLMIFNGDNAPATFLDSGADGRHIHAVDERIGHDGRGNVFSFNCRPASMARPTNGPQATMTTSLPSARTCLAPFVFRVFRPATG